MTWTLSTEPISIETEKMYSVNTGTHNILFGAGAEGKRMAELFMAAPEMLEALKFIRKELSQHTDRYAGNNPVMYAYRKAEEVIAKAEPYDKEKRWEEIRARNDAFAASLKASYTDEQINKIMADHYRGAD